MCTFSRAESPLLVLVIAAGGGTPEMLILSAFGGAVPVPLPTVLERQSAGRSLGIPKQSVDFYTHKNTTEIKKKAQHTVLMNTVQKNMHITVLEHYLSTLTFWDFLR